MKLKWLPKVVSMMVLWGAFAYVFVFIEPELLRDVLIEGIYLPMLVILFLALFYTLSLLLGSMRKGLLISLVMMLLVVLQILRFLTWPTVVIALGLASGVGLRKKNN